MYDFLDYYEFYCSDQGCAAVYYRKPRVISAEGCTSLWIVPGTLNLADQSQLYPAHIVWFGKEVKRHSFAGSLAKSRDS